MIEVADLIGIPYKDHGRDKNGLDCYGLALLVLERMGKHLDDVIYENHDQALSLQYAPLLNVRQIDFIKEGALIEIHVKGTLHIGVVLDNKQFIHATENQGVRISRIQAYKIAAIYEVI